MNDRTDGLIYARELKSKVERILNIQISSKTLSHYRHKILGTNYRRCNFQPKIFTPDEKDTRYIFSVNLKDLLERRNFSIKILSTDESTCKTGQFRTYQNRVPIARPRCVSYRPMMGKSLHVWAGISYQGVVGPVVCLYLDNKFEYINY